MSTTPPAHPTRQPTPPDEPLEETPIARGLRRGTFLAKQPGTACRARRRELGLSQRELAERAILSQREISRLESGLATSASVATWALVASVLDVQLAAFIEGVSGADEPRDMKHLKGQNVVIVTSAPGGWTGRPELLLPGSPFPRSVDVFLEREARREIAVTEVWDLITDGGAAMRSHERKVLDIRRERGDGWKVQGLFVVRATRRNHQLVAGLREVFAGRFPASAMEWLEALRNPDAPMPDAPGLLWVDLDGTRLLPSRLRQGR